MPTPISSEARDVLRNVHYLPAVSRLLITRDELAPKVFREVKEICTRLGARWNQASQSFLFGYDPTRALEVVQASGVMPPKNPYAHFQTPDSISEGMIRYEFRLFEGEHYPGYHHGQPLHACHYIPAGLRILEPSAGKGAIARWIRQLYSMLGREDYTLHCCEIDPINRAILEQQDFAGVADDFLTYHLEPGEALYDIVIMNPPFLDLEYIEHIEHAWELLSDREGRLVAIVPSSFFWREEAKCQRFRTLVRLYGEEPPMVYPRGRFKESGTTIETALVSLVKQDQSWRTQPYAGFPNWHCYMLDLHIAQTRTLYDEQWRLWQEVDRGVLPDASNHPAWCHTQRTLREFFARAIRHAKTDWWVEIVLDDTSQRFMEEHFLEYGRCNCQCERHIHERCQRLEKVHQQGHSRQVETSVPAPDEQMSPRSPVSSPYVQRALFSFDHLEASQGASQRSGCLPR